MRPDTALEARIDPLAAPFAIDCAPPFLTARFAAPQRTLGWSLLHPGFAVVADVVWVEVRNSALGLSVDPHAFLKARLAEAGLPHALAFMTSRDIRRHHFCRRRAEAVEAACLTTVGLSNGERVGSRKACEPHVGTINTLVHLSVPLTDGAMAEALSIVAQARTAAVVDSWRAERGPAVTGTGTDCIVVASPCGDEALACAGLHTAVGEAIGGAVYEATRNGAEQWTGTFSTSARDLATCGRSARSHDALLTHQAAPSVAGAKSRERARFQRHPMAMVSAAGPPRLRSVSRACGIGMETSTD